MESRRFFFAWLMFHQVSSCFFWVAGSCTWILGKTKTVDVHLHCSVCFQHRPYSDAPQLFESGYFAHGDLPPQKEGVKKQLAVLLTSMHFVISEALAACVGISDQ